MKNGTTLALLGAVMKKAIDDLSASELMDDILNPWNMQNVEIS